MTPRRLEVLQRSILDQIGRDHPKTPDAAIGDAAGCDRTEVSKFRYGKRCMDLREVVGLVETFGAVTVLGPIAALDGADVVPRAAGGNAADPRALSLEVTVAAAELGRMVHAGLADGRFDASELARILAQVEALVVDLRALSAGAQAHS